MSADCPPKPKRGRISVLIPNLFLGGAERYAINISGELSRRGHDVDLVVRDLSGPLADKTPVGGRQLSLTRRTSALLMRRCTSA